MKSLKLYFSLLLATVMFVMPLQAQENQLAESNEGEQIETPDTPDNEGIMLINDVEEDIVDNTESEANDVAVANQGSEGRDNTDIDKNFSPKAAIENFVYQSALTGDEEHPGFAMEEVGSMQ